MVYFLDDGPRGGQLVDDLPLGYARSGHVPSETVELFDGFEAERARWRPATETRTRWAG